MSVAENIQRVHERIAEACKRVGRRPEEVDLVGVSKGFSADAIRQAVAAGLRKIGENRVQEAEPKIRELGSICEWHMVGHLQTNKVRRALELFDVIQSVDRMHLAEELQRRAVQLDRIVPVLVEVNTSGEPTKFGFAPNEVLSAVRSLVQFDRLRIRGLMTIGAFTDDAQAIRRCFRTLRELSETIERERIEGAVMEVLSMGMSDDFEIAIEEGSTMVRIGRAIFGERPA
jgi:pyridoxal phosphate enzyme (YggS family)